MSRHGDSRSRAFDPAKRIKKLDIDVRALFERELALWLCVPFIVTPSQR